MLWRLALTAQALLAAACLCTQVQGQDTGGHRSTLFQWRAGEMVDDDDGPEVINPDRPDFTNSPETVGQGAQQIELGYTYNWDDSAGQPIASHSYPETLLRVGVVDDWFELRVAWNYASALQPAPIAVEQIDGAQDLYLGAKIALAPQAGVLPAVAIMPQMTLPTGALAFSADRVMPGVALLYAWDISDWLSLGGSTQVDALVDAGTSSGYAQWAQSFSFGYTLSETTHAFTEWYVIAPAGADTDRTTHYLDGGFAHRMGDNFQVDIRLGKGLSAADSSWFTGAGCAVRF